MRNRLLERFWPTELVEAREVAESKPLPAPPAPKPLGWGRAMVDYLKTEAPVRDRDPFRYDPDRLVPASTLVRQVRVDRIRLRNMGQVTDLLERIAQLVEVSR